MAAPIPDALSYERASVLPLGLSTAACGLFQKDLLALDHPTHTPVSNGKTLLVWGGSTSVGSNAIQLAVAAGYEVIATASPRNFDYVRGLGASDVFDYNAKTIVRDIIHAFEGKVLAGALAVGPTSASACVDIVRACNGNKFVAMATYPISFAHETGPEFLRIATRVRKFLWFSASMWFKTKVGNIRTRFIFGSSLINNEVSTVVYEDFLPRALASKQFIAAPPARVVGHGLASIQAALELQKSGVSAQKLVVTLARTT